MKKINIGRMEIYVFALSTFFIVLNSCSGIKEKPQKTYKVKAEVVKAVPERSKLELPSEITASSRHELSFLVAGNLIKVLVNEGQSVVKGQTLAVLDDSDYQQALQIAESKLTEANDQYQRLTRMYAAGSLAEADYEKIRLLKKEAEASYKLYKNKLEYTKLRAPVKGTVSKIWHQEGATLTQGQPVLTIINDKSVYARVKIPEANITQVNLNDSCRVIVRAVNDTLTGRVLKISPSASKITRTFETDIVLDNTRNALKDGMLCSVSIYEHATRNTIQVPLTLIITDTDKISYVFVGRNGIARKQRIVTEKLFGNSVEVSYGLKEGDTLLMNPPLNLLDGDKIQIN